MAHEEDYRLLELKRIRKTIDKTERETDYVNEKLKLMKIKTFHFICSKELIINGNDIQSIIIM
ncbi:hypothetical protein JOC34_002744 [Virgibacillus halotolerans]|uniref:hypothetical protein n=1 Tax=Virgibacillus halotolerans TaxID=1071053 RepID=UPI00196103B5|nr:hypothetical protein [Virgibacillus halotolerans]MBM7600353.1 hypothetical protein [Virgibacillus halotolerans]